MDSDALSDKAGNYTSRIEATAQKGESGPILLESDRNRGHKDFMEMLHQTWIR